MPPSLSDLPAAGPAPGCPRRGSAAGGRLARRLLALIGWRVSDDMPDVPRFVLIVAPHTSNWDFPICILAMFAVRLRLSWLGKHTLFRFPVAGVLRWLGGEPIDRGSATGTVETAIARFRTRAQWALGVSPEGTRRRVEEWRTGFYRIAVGAGVPIVPVRLDYSRRMVEILAPFHPGGDATADLRRIRALFHASMARDPDRFAELPAE